MGLGTLLVRHGLPRLNRRSEWPVHHQAHRPFTSSDLLLADLAKILRNLHIDLSAAGRPEETLATAEEAAGIWRRLAEADPAAHKSDLARSLDSLGTLPPELA